MSDDAREQVEFEEEELSEEVGAEDILPEIPTADPAEIPPDEGDVGRVDVETEMLPFPRGLSPIQRQQARNIVARGCGLLLKHAAAVHYSQDMHARWEGISLDRRISREEFPAHADCSSTSTWLLWNALRVHLGMGDVVNGTQWRSGYTGTMLVHGLRVDESNIQIGDCAFYGRPGSTGDHVVVCLGGGNVFSHGSEAGPYKLRLHYRGDLMRIRRYF